MHGISSLSNSSVSGHRVAATIGSPLQPSKTQSLSASTTSTETCGNGHFSQLWQTHMTNHLRSIYLLVHMTIPYLHLTLDLRPSPCRLIFSPVQTTQATTALHHHPNSQLQARISKPHTSRMPHQPKSRAHDDVVADPSHVLIVTLIPPIVNII